jgi:hypothetical protein
MTRTVSLIIRNLLFTLVVPGLGGVWAPWWILTREGRAASPAAWEAVPVIAAGAALYMWCVWNFAAVGRGTPGPWDVLSPRFAERSRALAAQSPDGTVPIAPGHWSAALMQDATPEQLSACLPRLVPCPLGWFDDPLAIPRGAGAHIPASYVFLREDRSIPREVYEAMAARLGRPRTVECEGSHQAMITRPEAVAKALLASAGGGGEPPGKAR